MEKEKEEERGEENEKEKVEIYVLLDEIGVEEGLSCMGC